MYIKEIIDPEYHGYDVIAEADIIVTDGQFELLCYHYDIENEIVAGMKIESIFAVEINQSNIIRADNREFIIEKDSKNHFSYLCLQGELIDRERLLVKIGNLIIEADGHLDKDIMQGEFVRLSADRLDIIL